MFINTTTGGSAPPRTPWPMATQTQEQMKHSHLKELHGRRSSDDQQGGCWEAAGLHGWWLQRGARHELSSPPTKCSGRLCLNTSPCGRAPSPCLLFSLLLKLPAIRAPSPCRLRQNFGVSAFIPASCWRAGVNLVEGRPPPRAHP